MKLNYILLITWLVYSRADPKTEYYNTIVKEEIQKAANYQMPTSNSEFTSGWESTNKTDIGVFDFIIVGAGSAGSVLAARLSELCNVTTLVLEAGGEETDFSNIPGMDFQCQSSYLNYGYYSTPQKYSCLGAVNKQCLVPRGKSIGGSSAINSVIYARGNKEDYNKWGQLVHSEWSYKNVLPYFKKSENAQVNGDKNYHGTEGFWNTESAVMNKIAYYELEATKELNLTYLEDYNGKDQIGSALQQRNTKFGIRQSLGTAFLSTGRQRKNLSVLTKSFVTKLVVDVNKKVARGVEFVTTTGKYKATAAKEVILSAGALNSPQLLMLSGIGPQDKLEKLNITTIRNLPTGENLIEHPSFLGFNIKTNLTKSNDTLNTMIDDYLKGEGILVMGFNTPLIHFIRTRSEKENKPNIELLFLSPAIQMPLANRMFNLDKSLASKVDESDITIFMILLHPKSRGTVNLKSVNPLDFPVIDLNMLENDEDVEMLLESIDFVLQLLETTSFKRMNATLINMDICNEYDKSSKTYWKCLIRKLTVTTYHPCGTTRMGQNETTSVVDYKFRVHGIKNLRVVDAGVIPVSISGHTNAPTVMVAEKAAAFIKNRYFS